VFYTVQFFRGGQRILEARTAETKLVVPASWIYQGRRLRLVRGRYIWIVRPAFRRFRHVWYGAPVVRANLVLTG
jgi:hypothetical protein